MTADQGVWGWVTKHKWMMKVRFHNLKPHYLSNITGMYSLRVKVDSCQCVRDLDLIKSNRGKATIINETPGIIGPPHITSYMAFNLPCLKTC